MSHLPFLHKYFFLNLIENPSRRKTTSDANGEKCKKKGTGLAREDLQIHAKDGSLKLLAEAIRLAKDDHGNGRAKVKIR